MLENNNLGNLFNTNRPSFKNSSQFKKEQVEQWQLDWSTAVTLRKFGIQSG